MIHWIQKIYEILLGCARRNVFAEGQLRQSIIQMGTTKKCKYYFFKRNVSSYGYVRSAYGRPNITIFEKKNLNYYQNIMPRGGNISVTV